MKQLLFSFTQYEHWANARLIETVMSLTEEQQYREISSSFPSIHKTLLHIWDASSIWWQRMHHVKHENIVAPSLSFHPNMQDVAKGLLQQNSDWIEYVKQLSEADMENILAFRTIKGDPFEQPVYDILLHLNNHGTYHRGQVITMLRQVGIEKLPGLDYILFSREREK